MKILSAEFVKSCERPDQFPKDRLPAVAFIGRSNVGKSSLINSLLRRKGLARVSRTPGKTQMINVFRVTTDDPRIRQFFVVDLPGYGYAKVSKTIRAGWQPMIEQYLTGSDGVRGVLQLVDSRGTERRDGEAVGWLLRSGIPVLLVATKSDKLTRSERAGSLAALREVFGLPGDADVVAYSSVTHEGRDELWQAIRKMVMSDV
ncbi:MAG: ribosome biogenesis GTP-binding protein YihA/YsxC [Burkholderiales bacterium]